MLWRISLLLMGLTLGLAGCQTTSISNPLHLSKVDADGPVVTDIHDLWERLRSGFGLGYNPNQEAIMRYRNQYARHHRHVETLAERARPFQYMIISAAESRKMPLEITLLPMVESALEPFADSHTKASGMWQIMPATATLLGLKQDWWYDARRDHIASTNAALDYLQYLHGRFNGDWLLALAAYNSGEGTVSRAILRNKSAGKPTDFFHLKLPKETRDYVPKLLAIAEIIKNPKAHNTVLPKIPNDPYLREVDVGAQIDLALAAELAEIDIKNLYKLNAGYNRWATHPEIDGPHHLLLPIKHALKLEKKLAYSDTDQWVNWQTYEVKPGDTLIKIARKTHSTVDILRTVNHLENDQIHAGRYLLTPSPLDPYARYAVSKQKCTSKGCFQDKKNLIHTVKSGESLWLIAKKYDVSVDNIMGWNQLGKKNLIKPGQKLVIRAS